ncbi:aldose 1-epimerase family protein [Corynebacterium tapiri]|uniref:Aldose epimerase n=1 Tax=Corynebacterium tapiri TaxID=1448266 RepID=A0A5C4U688_9CORY|nr:aldose 1-epimerase family protein [Corynebacterium tapiri]TNL99783.1 aldose epimerase [Corynebacterium tapiri]
MHIRLQHGPYSATISTLGGGVSSLYYEDAPLLCGYDTDYAPLSSGVILAPWPNRVADAAFIHRGTLHRLDVSEPARNTAIHGLVTDKEWNVAHQDNDRLTLTLYCSPHPGWPWPLNYAVDWQLSEDGLHMHLTVDNIGKEDVPFGLGLHPYLSAFGSPLDECTLHLDTTHQLPLDPARNLPAGPLFPQRAPEKMERVWLDHCFTVGTFDARLVNSEGRGVQLRADESFGWAQLFTADPALRAGYPGIGRALAVEPMTCPPDALRSGRDLMYLPPQSSQSFHMQFCAIAPV